MKTGKKIATKIYPIVDLFKYIPLTPLCYGDPPGDAMAEYTEHLEKLGYDIDPFDGDPEDFADQLMAVAAQFRAFDEAISLFIAEHGYEGDLEDYGRIFLL